MPIVPVSLANDNANTNISVYGEQSVLEVTPIVQVSSYYSQISNMQPVVSSTGISNIENGMYKVSSDTDIIASAIWQEQL